MGVHGNAIDLPVGIGQDDLCADLLKIGRGERLHGRLSADRHEDWCLDDTMGRHELPGPRLRLRIDRDDPEFKQRNLRLSVGPSGPP